MNIIDNGLTLICQIMGCISSKAYFQLILRTSEIGYCISNTCQYMVSHVSNHPILVAGAIFGEKVFPCDPESCNKCYNLFMLCLVISSAMCVSIEIIYLPLD